jgi:hypothetical protein
MPPKKQNDPSKTPGPSFSLKQAGKSGMNVTVITPEQLLETFVSQVNALDANSNPHPNKVELDRIRREYEAWETPVDLTDLEMAYYGLLFSTGRMFSGANQISKKFDALLASNDINSHLEFYKLIVMGNWLIENSRLDNISYMKLSGALNNIPPESYVVCAADVIKTLDLHSSMCYLNALLHEYDPAEYGTNLHPRNCPDLSTLPRTQGSIMAEQAAEQARLNNIARAAGMEAERGYAMAASKPASKPKTSKVRLQRVKKEVNDP